MAFREIIADFLAAQLDFIFFACGLAFVTLGAVCLAVARMRGPGSPWMPLGLFGFLHGAAEWLDLSALVVTDTTTFALIRTAALTASFLFLMEFARQKATRFGLKTIGTPLYAALVLLVILGGVVGGTPMAGAFARYGIGFFAAMAAACIIAAHARGFPARQDASHSSPPRHLRSMASPPGLSFRRRRSGQPTYSTRRGFFGAPEFRFNWCVDCLHSCWRCPSGWSGATC